MATISSLVSSLIDLYTMFSSHTHKYRHQSSRFHITYRKWTRKNITCFIYLFKTTIVSSALFWYLPFSFWTNALFFFCMIVCLSSSFRCYFLNDEIVVYHMIVLFRQKKIAHTFVYQLLYQFTVVTFCESKR